MPTYPNGEIPLERLELLAEGWDSDGKWEHRLPPTTAAKHRALVARGLRISGKTLRITPGWNGFRPLWVQRIARDRYGIGAATPGRSSHGGDWAGAPTGWARVDAAAIDYENWAEVFGSFEVFRREAAAVGLLVGGIMPPDWPSEPWHVIDLDPWGAVPASVEREGFLMGLNDQQQGELFNMVANLYHATFNGGPSMEDEGRPIQRSLAQLLAGARPVVNRQNPASGELEAISWLQELADTKTGVLELLGRPVGAVTVEIDAEDATAIGAQLAELLVADLGSLTDETIEKIAQASANELRDRLGVTPPPKGDQLP